MPTFLLRLKTNIAQLMSALVLFLSACTKQKLFDSDVFEFPGLEKISDNKDGTFKLSWEKVPSGEVTYFIYSRAGTENGYSFSEPFAQTSYTSWTTPNLRFVGSTCYIVRFVKAGGGDLDSNTEEMCTENEAYVFKGLESISVNDNGSLSLAWEKIPQDNVTYNVYATSTPGVYNFKNIFKSTSAAVLDVASYPSSTKQCFVVRYQIVDAPEDDNTNEVCPALPYISDFSGVSAATSSATASATVSWSLPTSGASDVAAFKIYKGAGFTEVAASAKGTETSATIVNLPVDTTVTFGVRAVDKYGREDTNTKTVNVTIINNATPSFNGLTTAAQVSGQLSVKLDWVAADGKISSYKIYYGVGASGTTPTISYTTPIASTDGATLTKTISGLGDDLSYCFDVRATTSGGQESTTANAKCVTLADSGAPVFAGITSASFSAGGAQIAWTASSSQVTSYYVYYQTGSGPLNFSTASYQIVSNSAPPTTQKSSTTILGLQDNTTYTFAVRAMDSHAVSDTNTASRTVTSSDLTPPVFLGVTSLTATDDTHLSVTFNRSTETDMNSYSVRVRETSVGGAYTEKTTVAHPSSGATVTATISGLLPATSYDVLVKAIDTAGNVSTNTLATARATLDLTPPTFGGLTAVGLDPADQSKVKVSWSAASDASGVLGYRVYYSTATMSGCASALRSTFVHPHSYTGCSASVSMSTLVTTGSSISFAGLTEGSTYYFIVHALDNSNVNNEDVNTVQSAFNVPYYTPPAAPSSVAITGGNGPSANNAITVTGTGATGNTIKIYVNGTYSTQQVINSGTSFSIPVTLSTTPGTYGITATQVNLSSLEGAASTVINYVLQNAAPTATLSGTPCTPTTCYTSSNALAVTVAGTNVTTYQYALIWHATSVSTACSAASYNGAWTAIATQITNSLTTNGDGAYRLCVIGKDTAGNAQSAASATQFDFTRDTAPPSPPATVTIKNPITNSTSITYSPEISATVASVTGASKYCVTPTNVQPASNAACWSTGTTLTVTLTSTGAVPVYAWSQKISGIVSATSTASSNITYTNICDSGTLATSTTCTISAAKTVADGDHIAGQGNMTITSAGSITGNATERFTITLGGNFTAQSGAGNRILGNVTINAANINIQGTVSATARGYQGVAAGVGSPGASGGGVEVSGSCSSNRGGGGGGHAGAGSAPYAWGGVQPSAGAVNASLNAAQPITFGGSGGGAGTTTPGGHGGGAIKLNATSTLTIDGTVSADGSYGTQGAGGCYGGGGAGGSLWIIAQSVAGTGVVSAQGASGYSSSSTVTYGGSGGGGAVAITSASSYFKGTIKINSGLGYGTVTEYNDGFSSPGKLTVNYSNPCDTGDLSTVCTISGPLVWGSGQTFSASGNLVVASGGSLKGPAKSQFISLAVTGSITVQNGGSVLANLSDVTAASFTIDAGGSVSADGLGYFGSSFFTNAPTGTSGATGTNLNGAGGGGHGGRGGVGGSSLVANASYTGGTYVGGVAHDSYTQPILFGGAGGGSANPAYPASPGGGAIKISVGTLTVNGTLSANGAAGQGNAATASNSSGGGAGGAIWLNVTSLSGSGSVTANGGAGGGSLNATYASGGGAGGRIAAYNTNKFGGSVQALGGSVSGSQAGVGEPGTVYFANNSDNYCNSGTFATGCTISQTWALANGTSIVGSGNLTIASGGLLYSARGEGATLTATGGTITIQNGGSIKGNFTINATNLSVNSGGTITADGWGYLGVYGSAGLGNGAGTFGTGNCCNGGGGAHGGLGGQGHNGGASTVTYGTASAPVTFGSAGGTPGGWVGGSGGGAIRIILSGTAQVDGSITADGQSRPSGVTSGGGAGGSIYLTTVSLPSSSSGVISANGGAGGFNAGGGGGGGGGGRVKISVATATFTGGGGTVTANGGAAGGGSATAGASGTVQ